MRCKKFLEVYTFLRYIKSFAFKFHVFHNNAITVQRSTWYATKDPKCYRIQVLLNISRSTLLIASVKFIIFVSNSCCILGYGYLKLSCFSIDYYYDIYRISTSGLASGNTRRQFPAMGIYFIKSDLRLWWPKRKKTQTYLNVCVLTKKIFCNENNESIFIKASFSSRYVTMTL